MESYARVKSGTMLAILMSCAPSLPWLFLAELQIRIQNKPNLVDESPQLKGFRRKTLLEYLGGRGKLFI